MSMKVKYALILILFINSFFILSSHGEERIYPVRHKACGHSEYYTPDKMWYINIATDRNWCCFHNGYNIQQVHWCIMDLAQVYPISKIIAIHEGGTQQTHLLTEDFSFYGSVLSDKGPWQLIREFKDNIEPKSTCLVQNRPSFRYIKLEVTDSQLGSSANQNQGDWAVRIAELEIYTSPTDSPSVTVNQPAGDGKNPFRTSGSNTQNKKVSSPFLKVNPSGRNPVSSTPKPFTQPSSVYPPGVPLKAPPVWKSNYMEALAEAKRENKPILVLFYSPNGKLSRDLENKALKDSAVIIYLKNYILCRINMSDSNNQKISKYYEIFKAPTLVFLNSNGYFKGTEMPDSSDVSRTINILKKWK